MRQLARTFRDRLAPAVLTAAGVALLAAGLLHYGSPAQAGQAGPDASPSDLAGGPTASWTVPSLPPIDGSAAPSVAPSADPHRVATRIVIDTLDIDLPIIRQPDPSYPSCNVAMYLEHPQLGQPGSGGSVYLYAHARDGMFGPLYTRAILGLSGGAKSLIGQIVYVYTSDDFVYEYQINKVYPRVKADSHFLDVPLAVKHETLWLQTSTGPNETYPKLQVRAAPLFVGPAAHKDAHPKAHPVNCAH
jgi:hypothetical protein